MTLTTLRSVLIIEIGPFLAGSADEKRRVAQKVGRACEEIGFLMITGHSVSADLIEKTYALAREFFHSPNSDTLLTCIESCCGPEHPPKYAPVEAGEYLDNKSRRTREARPGMG